MSHLVWVGPQPPGVEKPQMASEGAFFLLLEPCRLLDESPCVLDEKSLA
jgi:hypothetical protein